MIDSRRPKGELKLFVCMKVIAFLIITEEPRDSCLSQYSLGIVCSGPSLNKSLCPNLPTFHSYFPTFHSYETNFRLLPPATLYITFKQTKIFKENPRDLLITFWKFQTSSSVEGILPSVKKRTSDALHENLRRFHTALYIF